MIEIIDAFVGAGKTTYAIDTINNSNAPVIYVTPFLDEVERIETACPRMSAPSKIESETKLDDFKKMLYDKKSICTTHSLFKGFDQECYDLIKAGDYNLILDEVITTIQVYGITSKDIDLLQDGKKIKIVGEDRELKWIDPDYKGKFSKFKRIVERGNIYMITLSDEDKYIIAWEMPLDKFVNFKDITILTYLFEGSEMSCYFKMHNIPYTLYSLKDYKKIPYNRFTENREELKELVTVYDGKINNNFGDSKTVLSVSWYKNKNNKEAVKKLNKNTSNYFKNIVKSSTKNLLWSCFEEDIDRLENNYCTAKNYNDSKSTDKTFLSFNARATNAYRDRNNLAYLVNIFVNPVVAQYFKCKGDAVLDNDLYAISTLIQWLGRSAIRDGKPISLYCPSKRMRDLLNKFFNYEI